MNNSAADHQSPVAFEYPPRRVGRYVVNPIARLYMRVTSSTSLRTRGSHPGRLLLALLFLVPLILATAGQQAAAVIAKDSRPVPVSGPDPLPADCDDESQRGRAHDSAMAVDPTDDRLLAVAWTQDLADGIVTATTRDGGRTWSNVAVPNKACIPDAPPGLPYTSALDPALAFTPGGTLVVAAQVTDNLTNHAVAVNRSTDDGVSWQAPVFVAADQIAAELAHPTLAAGPGAVYLAWSGSGQNGYMSVSTDDGRTWSTPSVIYAAAGGLVIPMQLLLLKDGSLTAVLARLDPALAPGAAAVSTTLLATRTEDAGQTWSPPSVIAMADPNHSVVSSSALAPDGAIHVAWQTTSPRPAYLIATSRDQGRSWSRPTAVDGDIGSPVIGNKNEITDATLALAAPALAVNSHGIVGVAFYRHSPAVCTTSGTGPLRATDEWVRHSHDGGITWEETHLAGPFDQTALTDDSQSQGMAAMGDAFAMTYPLGAPCQGAANFALTNTTSDIFFSRIGPNRALQ